MSARVILIGKKKYLAGMSWRSFDHEQTRRDLIAIGSTMFGDRNEEEDPHGADWCVLRPVTDQMLQAGFCQKPEGVRGPSGLTPLAPLVASAEKQPWLATFKLGEGLFWYCAVRDEHAILPDGDVVGDEATVMAVRERHIRIYADWSIPFQESGSVDDLLDLVGRAKEKPNKVIPLKGSGISVEYMAAGAGIFLALSGVAWWMHVQHFRKVDRLHQAALARQHLAALKRDHQPALLPPLSKLATEPMPDGFVHACLSSISGIKLSEGGWVFKSATCTIASNRVQVSWSREEGASTIFRPAGDLSADANSVISAIPIAPIPDAGHAGGAALDVEREALQGWAQRLGVEIKFTAEAPHPQASAGLPGQTKNAAESGGDAVPASPAIAFEFSMTFDPRVVVFNAFPGLRIESVVFDGQKWNLKGGLYGK